MSKELEALERLRFGKASNSDISLIKKALKALEIIKEKADVQLIQDKDEYFLLIYIACIKITKHEFDLLKEVLL